MAEGMDDVRDAFATEVAPKSQPRDQAGKFIAVQDRPEPMFGERPIEGEADDAGDDETLRQRERDVADGRAERHELEERSESGQEVEEGEPSEEEDEGAERYPVVIDGESREVTLKEALAGYIRQETFHKRHAQLVAFQRDLEADYARQQQNWALWNKARQEYEQDLASMIPQEPNWDELFARDPRAAHSEQKVYQLLYGKLAGSQQARAQREVQAKEEADRRLEKYAVESFSRWVASHPKELPDEKTLNYNLQSMRRTAAAAGFSEYEIATVYDPRMLDVLFKASKYDRMQANSPKPAIPGKGKTLTPGAATPLGNARRGIDDAQRRLAQTGRLDDATAVFRKILR